LSQRKHSVLKYSNAQEILEPHGALA